MSDVLIFLDIDLNRSGVLKLELKMGQYANYQTIAKPLQEE